MTLAVLFMLSPLQFTICPFSIEEKITSLSNDALRNTPIRSRRNLSLFSFSRTVPDTAVMTSNCAVRSFCSHSVFRSLAPASRGRCVLIRSNSDTYSTLVYAKIGEFSLAIHSPSGMTKPLCSSSRFSSFRGSISGAQAAVVRRIAGPVPSVTTESPYPRATIRPAWRLCALNHHLRLE